MNELSAKREAPEVIIVDNDADEVSCDGGGGALGHPVVWYSFAGTHSVTCQYCDREFVKRS
ncbi:MAG: zinc-finger domain-containing protein [Micavibrio sp.]